MKTIALLSTLLLAGCVTITYPTPAPSGTPKRVCDEYKPATALKRPTGDISPGNYSDEELLDHAFRFVEEVLLYLDTKEILDRAALETHLGSCRIE